MLWVETGEQIIGLFERGFSSTADFRLRVHGNVYVKITRKEQVSSWLLDWLCGAQVPPSLQESRYALERWLHV